MTTKDKVKDLRKYFESINNCGSNSITQANALWLIETIEHYMEVIELIKEDAKSLREGLEGYSSTP